MGVNFMTVERKISRSCIPLIQPLPKTFGSRPAYCMFYDAKLDKIQLFYKKHRKPEIIPSLLLEFASLFQSILPWHDEILRLRPFY